MKFRNPDQKARNLLRLLPVLLLLIAVPLAGVSTYRYATGADDDWVLMALSLAAIVYLSVRSWMELRTALVWSDESPHDSD